MCEKIVGEYDEGNRHQNYVNPYVNMTSLTLLQQNPVSG